jgi:HAE1 family hydrophobic/amphiphilic exporter-1
VYPGASASEVETSVTKKIEDALSSLENLDAMTSTSQEGFSMVTIELKSAADPTVAVEDAQRKINAVLADLPSDVKSPVISKFSPSDMPIMKFAVTSSMEPKAFYQLVDDRIKPMLSKLPGVGQVTLVGGTKREINVNLDPEKLRAYNISILQALVAIEKANQDYPTGKVEHTDKQYTVRLAAKFVSLDQLRNTVVAVSPQGSKVFVKDLGEVEDGTIDLEQLSRLNSTASIGVQIQKQTDANTVEVARLVKIELANAEKEYAAQNVKFAIATDSSIYTMDSVNAVVEDLFLAILIVSIVCFLFLHSLRSALIVMVAVPLSMLPAFIFLYLFGYSLNIMSLMALSLAVGILVDDSIVVVENIYSHLEQGKTKLQAALDGSKQILVTAISITLVITIVFLPLAMTGGIIGNILREFALPLIVSTLASLLVSFTLTPLLLSKFGRLENLNTPTIANRFASFIENSFQRLKRLYATTLAWALGHRKYLFGGVLLLFVGVMSLLPAGFIGSTFVPNTDQGEFVIDLEFAPQISVQENNFISQRMEDFLLAKPEVKKVMSNVGSSSTMLSTNARNNITQMTVTISEKKDRAYDIDEYCQNLKTELAKLNPGVKIRISPTTVSGGAGTSPIQIAVKGTDYAKVTEVAAIVMDVTKKTAGTTDVKYSVDDPKPEIKVAIDRDKMAQLGLSIADVGATMHTAYSGNTDSKYRVGNTEYDIKIAYDKFDRQNIADVSKITFINDQGQLVELNQFASVTQAMGPSQLEHRERTSSMTINSNVVGRPSGTVADEIKKSLEEKVPEGIDVEFIGMIKKQAETFSSLGYAMLAAIILVYLIMVALYNSLKYPLVVLFSIPLALIGSILALALAGESLNIFSIIGNIVLIGLVAKNAILLVDFTNHLREKGMVLKEALIEAGKERLRPILMTTLAMIFGMLPIAVATGAGAELKNGMAWVIIGGLTSSLVLTLLVVPSVYLTFENISGKFNAIKNARRARIIQPAAETK